MEISVTNFSAPNGASVFKFCVHYQIGKVYCVNEKKKMLILILPSFFNFSFFFCHSYILHMDIFSVKDSSATTLVRIMKCGTKLDNDEFYCVTRKKQPHVAYQSLYLFIFLSLQWKFLSQISQLLLEPVF